MRQRIQKVLAAQGVGSRRDVEAWIVAGRILVNGRAATAGQAIGPRDEVRLDGRKLRLRWDDTTASRGLAYHRPAMEGLNSALKPGDRSSVERLPKPFAGRWIALSPMGAGEGGLELFVSDGQLAAAIMKKSDVLSSEFSVRVRGGFDESRIAELLQAAASDPEAKGSIDELECAGGEGVNRWARVVCTGLRPRDLKRIFERCGIEANRILRVRFGPIAMDRSLARGVSRPLTPGELRLLADAAGLPREPVARPRPKARAGSAKRRPSSTSRRGKAPRR